MHDTCISTEADDFVPYEHCAVSPTRGGLSAITVDDDLMPGKFFHDEMINKMEQYKRTNSKVIIAFQSRNEHG